MSKATRAKKSTKRKESKGTKENKFLHSKTKHFDIIVIGAGSGGLNVASFMNKAGFSVLLCDKTDRHIGGDCLNWGCVPSKALIHTARLAASAQELQKFGVKTTGKINLKKVTDHIYDIKETIREHENAEHFQARGMDVVLGKATFASKNSVLINGKEYSAKKIILATGASPRKLQVPGIDKVNYQTNESIFELKTLPKKLLIIGGGPIGMELGQSFQRLGSQVTIIDSGDQFLPKEDKDIAQVLEKQLQKEGIEILYNQQTIEFPTAKSLKVKDAKTNKTRILKFDEVLISIGRSLNINGLNLAKAGIQKDESGHKLLVNDYLETTNKNVLACGDVAGSYQFTHAAEMHAAVIIHNFFIPKFLSFLKKKINYDKIAWVTYTSPEIATFGLSPTQLNQRKIKYELFEHSFTDDDRAITQGTTYGKAKLYVSTKGRILGGTMAARDAGELVQELLLANNAEIHINKIFSKVYPYPTAARINKYTIRPWFARKMTERAKKLMQFFY